MELKYKLKHRLKQNETKIKAQFKTKDKINFIIRLLYPI